MSILLQPRLIVSEKSMPSFYPQQAARLSLCLRIPDNLGEGAYSFLFRKFGFKPYTLKILFVSVLFVFTESIEPVVSGGLRAALYEAFFQ